MKKIGNIWFSYPPVMLAPMEDVTDSSFRRICREMGADWVVTEFISAEGILRKENNYADKLNFLPDERPVSIQIFSSNTESLKGAIEIAEYLKPDFIDLNMGCPAKKIVLKGAGAALLHNPRLMEKLAKTAVKASNIPVTVKTRIGIDLNNISILENALRLQETGICGLIIHGRTKSQLFTGFANWDIISTVKNDSRIFIPVIGNGDITTARQAIDYQKKYGVDGIMIGRASIGNPFIFRQINELRKGFVPGDISTVERIETLKKHFCLSVKWNGLKKTLLDVRKHYSGYFKHFNNFKKYKQMLMSAQTQNEIFDVLYLIESKYS